MNPPLRPPSPQNVLAVVSVLLSLASPSSGASSVIQIDYGGRPIPLADPVNYGGVHNSPDALDFYPDGVWAGISDDDYEANTYPSIPFGSGNLTVTTDPLPVGRRDYNIGGSADPAPGVIITGSGGERWELPSTLGGMSSGLITFEMSSRTFRGAWGAATELGIGGFTPGSVVTVAFFSGMSNLSLGNYIPGAGPGEPNPLAVAYEPDGLYNIFGGTSDDVFQLNPDAQVRTSDNFDTTFSCLTVPASGTLTFAIFDPIFTDENNYDPFQLPLQSKSYLQAIQVSECGCTVVPIPEPSTSALGLISALCLGFRRRR